MDQAQRLGINVTIENGLTEVYLFDTGSSPFTSGWATNAPWWPSAAAVDTSITNPLQYGPGSGENRFYYYNATNQVSLYGNSGPVSAPIAIYGLYAHYTNSNGPGDTNANWISDPTFPVAISNAVASNTPPFTGGFFGIFGSDLTNTNHGLLNLLISQTYGTNVVRGFIIDGNTNSPKLTVAPTPGMVQGFNNVFPMNTNSNGSILQNLISPSYSISLTNGFTLALGNMPTLLDTGTPPADQIFITQGMGVDVSAYTTNVGGNSFLLPGTSFSMQIGNTPYTLTSTSNNPISVYGSPQDASSGGITYGLNFFEQYHVFYNLQDQTVGIQIIPEPTTYALFGLGAFGVLMVMRRKKRA